MSGCKVRTKTSTRQSGMPQAQRRSHFSARTWCDSGADRAPLKSQSTTLLVSQVMSRRSFARPPYHARVPQAAGTSDKDSHCWRTYQIDRTRENLRLSDQRHEIFLEPLRCFFREFIRGTIMNWWMFARLYERRIWLVQLVHCLVFTSSWDVDANCELEAIG